MRPRSISNSLAMALALFILACQPTQESKTDQPVNYLTEDKEDFNERMEWWRDAKFGMFIHWGLYAIPAGIYKGDSIPGIGEWIMHRAQIPVADYEQYAGQFNPVKFDATTWASIAKNAGMKYMVITSKHHDGFCLWDSEVTEYDIMDASPFKRDILRELADACAKEGIKLGFYHSIMDWHHPNAQAPHYPTYNTKEKENPNFPDYFENYLKPQVKELVTKYDPAILWFDGEWIPEFTHEQGLELYNFVRSLKPDILINNRVDKGRQGMQGMNKEGTFAGDFGTPEQEILEGTSSFDWESCMTLNDTWGYKSWDHNWKSTTTLIHNLVDIAAKGGNFLLNVGPTAEGEIPEPSVERLLGIGEWLEINGEAIYETEKLQKNYREGENIRYTKQKDAPVIYAVSLQHPGGELVLSFAKPQEGSDIELLGSDEPIHWTFQDDKGLAIEIPEALYDQESAAWVFKIRGEEVL